MRTTLTLDDAVCRRLKERAGREGKSFKTVVNEALRAGIEATARAEQAQDRFVVDARHCGFRPGIDIEKLNELVDELAAERLVETTERDAT